MPQYESKPNAGPLQPPPPQMKMTEEELKRKGPQWRWRDESFCDNCYSYGLSRQNIPSRPLPPLIRNLPLHAAFATKLRYSALLFEMRKVTVQRIHQQPLIVHRPRPQGWPAFIHASFERYSLWIFLEDPPNQIRSCVNKSARLAEKLRHLRTMEGRPVAGINPLNFKSVQQLQRAQIGEHRIISRRKRWLTSLVGAVPTVQRIPDEYRTIDRVIER